MSSKQALAAARRRRGASQQVMAARAQSVATPTNPATNNKQVNNKQINLNQYVVFLNNKIETIETRVNETLQKLETRIVEEISKMENTPLGLNVSTLEQAIEMQKSKMNKMNALINDLQHNYLVLNTSLISMKENIKPEMKDIKMETDHTEFIKKTDVVSVSIKEEEEESEESEEEKEKEKEEKEEKEEKVIDDVHVEPEPSMDEHVEPEPSTEEQNVFLENVEKTD